jgi:hypothetical protein
MDQIDTFGRNINTKPESLTRLHTIGTIAEHRRKGVLHSIKNDTSFKSNQINWRRKL